jgi:dihydrofolate synthase / folylpolyglutamate synthase
VTYQQTLDFLFAQLPMFHRVGPAAYKPGLDNTIRLLDLLGNPHLGIKCIHVAGTNGKGSTSHLLASILQSAGYKTGLYTSPHLKDFRERIRVNGVMIEPDFVVDFVALHHPQWQDLQPSFFEITVAMCFEYFRQQQLDVAVIETGLGGRLDSTNVILPDLSIVTNVSMDHMNLLGNTIESIATEKAGIIKSSTPVVIGPMHPLAQEIMILRAKEMGASLTEANNTLIELFSDCPLQGSYQQQNFCTVGTAVQVLRSMGYILSDAHVAEGAKEVINQTGLLGRWQVLGVQPRIIADVAHNEDGLKQVIDQLSQMPCSSLRVVLGMVADKDVNRVLKLLPAHAVYYFCKADIPRGMPASELMQHAEAFDLKGRSYDSVKEAFEAAKQEACAQDIVFVGGSIFTVAEVL